MKPIYADTSACLPLFKADAFTPQARKLRRAGEWVVSDLAAAEFISRLALGHHRGDLSAEQVEHLCADFDLWRSGRSSAELQPKDLRWAEQAMRGLDASLRTIDALHLATAFRLGVRLLTFDRQLAAAALLHSVEVVPT